MRVDVKKAVSDQRLSVQRERRKTPGRRLLKADR
jgi:hypothetical protein